jgi:DNA repair protein RadD
MILRYYQQAAKDAIYKYLNENKEGNPCAVIPTGGGKTPLLAEIVKDVTAKGCRVLITTHVQELLQQAAEKLDIIAPDVNYGIYSAGLGYRNTENPVIIGGIQSIYNKADQLGAFSVIIIDEAHLIPETGDGMYRTFISDMQIINPKVRIIGLTATPYRMNGGHICKPENILNDICNECGVRELIAREYLCPLTSKAGKEHADLSKVHKRGGEYIAEEMQAAMSKTRLLDTAIAEILERTQDRKSVLIFCAGVEHGREVQKRINSELGPERCLFISGDTPKGARKRILADFKDQKFKYIANVGVLTTGFDAPGIDCVVLLRATLSPGLYYQMVGRGLRMAEGKDDCLVLDYGDNICTHGPIDAIYVKDKRSGSNGKKGDEELSEEGNAGKECPKCSEVVAYRMMVCPKCGHEFPPPHHGRASGESVISEPVDISYDVDYVDYHSHKKKKWVEGMPLTLRVDYTVGFGQIVSEWVCVEHEGYARRKAEAWWKARSRLDVPKTVKGAYNIATQRLLKEPEKITVREQPGQFARIVDYVMKENPDRDTRELVLMAHPDEIDTPKEIPGLEDWDKLDDLPF